MFPAAKNSAHLLLFWFAIAFQEPALSDPLTLERVIESVRTSFPKIKMQLRKAEEAESKELESRGELDLYLSAGAQVQPKGYYQNREYYLKLQQPTTVWGTTFYGGWRSGQGAFAPYEGKRVTGSGGELSAGLQIPLLRGGWIDSRRAKIQQAIVGVRGAKSGLSTTELLAVRAAGIKFWKWVEACRRVEIGRDLLLTAKERQGWIQRKVKAGDFAALQDVENQRVILDRQNKLVDAERDERQAALELSLYLRDEKGEPVVPSVNQAPADFPEQKPLDSKLSSELKEKALKSRPDLEQLAAELAGVVVTENLKDNELWPQLDVYGEISQDLGATDPTRSPTELRAGIQLSIPLERRKAKGARSAARAKRLRIESELSFLRDQIGIEVESLVTAIRAVQAQVGLAEAEVAANEALVKGERTRFKMGDSQIFLVNMREVALGDSLIRLIKARTLYQIALIEISTSIGQLGNLQLSESPNSNQ